MTGAPSPMAHTLQDEIGKLKEFIALLQREQDLLKAGDTETLLPLLDTKNALAAALAALAQARERTLAELALPAGRAGMEAWLSQQANASLRPVWDDLLELARQARALNELNGKLIGLHLAHNQQALAALMSAANQAMTYGPDGQRQTGLGGRIIGSA